MPARALTLVLLLALAATAMLFVRERGVRAGLTRETAVLVDVLQQVTNELAVYAGSGHDRRDLKAALLAAGDRLEERLAGQPLVEADLRLLLGEAALEAGDVGAARAHIDRALMLNDRHRGSTDPRTLRSHIINGLVFAAEGKSTEAGKTLGGALDACRAHLPGGSSVTIDAAAALGAHLLMRGRTAEAELLLQDASHTTRGARALVELLIATDRPDDAVEFLEARVRRTAAEHGVAHELTMRTRDRLALVQRSLGRKAEARRTRSAGLRDCVETLGDQAPPALDARAALGGELLEAGELEQASAHLEIAVAGARRFLTPDRTGRYLVLLGRCATARGDFDRAEEQIMEAVGLIEGALGPRDPHTRSGVRALVELYTAWGKDEQADVYRTVLERTAKQYRD